MKQKSTTTILLAISILLNILLVFVTIKEEKRGHWISRHFEKSQPDESQQPDYWSVVGWNNTIRKLNYDCDICFFGHSQIAMSDFQNTFPHKKIVNLGYPGDNVDGMLRRVDPLRQLNPEKVFVMCGVNSLGMADTTFQKKYHTLVDSVRRTVPHARIYLFNILPERDGDLGEARLNAKIQSRNKYIAHYASSKGLTCIDLFTPFCDKETKLKAEYSIDGLHIDPDGYTLWASLIEEYI